jgi:transcriptional regulator with XRE-family HTH domain
LPKDAPEQKHAPKAAAKQEARQAVSTAVTERMHQLGLTVAEINRRTGLSETTIYAVIQVTGQPTKSTLALLSAVLDWRLNHLYNILRGRAHENIVTESPLEKNLAQLVRGLADINTLREDVSELKDVVNRIDGKVDVVIASRDSS